MIEEGVANEVILGLVVTAKEDNGQRPSLLRPIAIPRAARPLIGEITRNVVPPSKMTMEAKLGFLRKISQDRLNADLYRLFVVVKISTTIEVVLVNDRPSIEPLRT